MRDVPPDHDAPPSPPLAPLLVPRPRGARRRAPSLVDVTLDPAQRAAVALPPGRALLVLGEAGHGKTTVALHRVARVSRDAGAGDGGAGGRAAVIVPSEGLARLLQPLLRRLGADVEALTYDRWAAAEARRAFRRLPRESELTPASVMRVKRDPALRVALEELARRAPGAIDDDPERPAPRRGRALAVRADLQHLFGDRLLLERVAAQAAFGSRAIADVLDRTRVQFGLTAEEEYADVDAARLVAVDRRALDEGTAYGDVKTVDAEDYAVLFELDRMRAARRDATGAAGVAPRPHAVLMLDEAQELAPLELALIGRALAPGGTLVVAGDADQQTDATTAFRGWDRTMRELGFGPGEYETVQLGVGYRCPAGVVEIARRVRGPAPAPATSTAADVVRLRCDDERALVARLGEETATLLRHDRTASVAVLCRSPLTARRLAAALREHVPARLVFDGRFLPRGPVQVTTVDEVKGLEFDYVIVPDATARDYPDDPASRRILYVAVTRTRHQLLLASAAEPTPLAPPP